MEQTMNVNQKYGKEVGYNENRHDYVADGEITITITLAEYRSLVSNLSAKETELRLVLESNEKALLKIHDAQAEVVRLKSINDEMMKVLESKREQADSF